MLDCMLNAYLMSAGPWQVLTLMTKREELLAEHTEMLISSKDPNRLRARGAAQLLKKEEMIRAAYKNKLPKMVEELRQLTRDWEASEAAEGKPLTFRGVPILATLDACEDGSSAPIASKVDAGKPRGEAAPKTAPASAGTNKPASAAGVRAAVGAVAALKKGVGAVVGGPPNKMAAAAAAANAAARASKLAPPDAAPPPPPPPPPPTPGMMMQLQPPLMAEERVPGEELEGIACMQSLAEEPEPPRHAEPSPAVLKALELAAARRSTERAVLPTPAHPNAFMTPAAPVKGGKLGADENQNQLQSA